MQLVETGINEPVNIFSPDKAEDTLHLPLYEPLSWDGVGGSFGWCSSGPSLGSWSLLETPAEAPVGTPSDPRAPWSSKALGWGPQEVVGA